MKPTTNLQNFTKPYLELDPNKRLFAPDDTGKIIYEIWKDIPKFEGYYQVSNFGRIKSLSRYQSKKERILTQSKTNHGYLSVCLSVVDKKRYQTHQLVAICFLNHKPCGLEKVVDHKDNDRINNNLSKY